MEMVFVLLYINREAVVLPEKYPKVQCEALIKDLHRGECIPVPDYLIKSDKCAVNPRTNIIACPN